MSKLGKAKANKEFGLKTKKETNLDGEVQPSKNGTVYFTTTKDTVHGVATTPDKTC